MLSYKNTNVRITKTLDNSPLTHKEYPLPDDVEIKIKAAVDKAFVQPFKWLMDDVFDETTDISKLIESIKDDAKDGLIKSIFSSATEPEFSDKHKLKAKLKEEIKYRFKIGDHYMLRIKSKSRSQHIKRIYEIKQIIWSMNEIPIQAVVVKQIAGPNSNIMTLNIHDCKRLHVKYEAGLQVLSMKLNWIKLKNKDERK